MFRKAKVTVEEGLTLLQKAGLDSLPGGGAEIFHREYGIKSAQIKLIRMDGF
jgi:aminodeoxyfutalosine synthase